MKDNPFADLADDEPLAPQEAVEQLLAAAKRDYTPVRNVFVQQPAGSAQRASLLARFVTKRQERALDALLTLYALQPVLTGADDYLPLGAWANLLSTRRSCGISTVSATFSFLEHQHLVRRSSRGRFTAFIPLLEDGSGRRWTRPGAQQQAEEPVLTSYFTIPHAYWNDGYIDRLRLPGKAMLLILLKETQGTLTFEMAVERAQAWYGISERTAERGYGELSSENLIDVHRQRVASPRLPRGVLRDRYHRALREPFSTAARQKLQVAARAHHQNTTQRKGGT